MHENKQNKALKKRFNSVLKIIKTITLILIIIFAYLYFAFFKIVHTKKSNYAFLGCYTNKIESICNIPEKTSFN